MNLLAYTAGVINPVNPRKLLTVRLAYDFTTNAAGLQQPSYETPTSFTASSSGDGVLNVLSITGGHLGPLQTVSGADVPAGVTIVRQLSGTAGGVGTYQLAGPLFTAGELMSSELSLLGQIQPVSWKDLQQIEGLNLNGTRKTIYLFGVVDAIVRSLRKGGSLIFGPGDQQWLVAQVIEQWYEDLPSWCSVAATLQNERS